MIGLGSKQGAPPPPAAPKVKEKRKECLWNVFLLPSKFKYSVLVYHSVTQQALKPNRAMSETPLRRSLDIKSLCLVSMPPLSA